MERAIESAISDVFDRGVPQKLPMLPEPATLHLMAKAAATVYEAVVDSQAEDQK